MQDSSYTLVEVASRIESDAIVDLAWIAYHDPYQRTFQIFHPVFGPTSADREAAIQADKERMWQKHISNPNSHWLYVVHDQTGKVVGSGQWLVYKEAPWPNGPQKVEASWWPEGEGREFASLALTQCFAPRMHWCNRPHIAMNQTSVHPEYRKRGVGSLLMEWGVAVADKLNLESFIEATDSGRFLYEKFGYRTLLKVSFSPERKNPSQEWARLISEMTPFHVYITWRPAGGVFEEGKPQTPWQVDQFLAREGAAVKTPAMLLFE
ncbi:hypothetical protein LAWI1_G007978 [Lachnellula willkommii]|uniref:N-acetyltransferase domain-containing protein n=1 Tax=Lachnellula willkommii TaxID=215461 RepID=A0A559M075_9HELO|nr:hypothetical protein LAWI1_G007978 [Lachnellula willkommii]